MKARDPEALAYEESLKQASRVVKRVAPVPECIGSADLPETKLLIAAAEANATVMRDGIECVPEIVSVSRNIVAANWDEAAREVGPLTYTIRFIRADAFEWSE